MKVTYIRNDGVESYFLVRAKKQLDGTYKPVLITPEKMRYQLYKGQTPGFQTIQALREDTAVLISQYRDNVVID